MDKKEFFEKFTIDENAFDKLGVSWGELEDIYADYSEKIPVFEDTARYLADLMNKEKSIHSIKYRVKDKEHLIEKIIRKSIENPDFIETYKDYGKSVKDLIGMRALHLFKENWIDIHNFLSENWEFYTTPRANYKKGDPQRLLDMYSAVGCELNEHRNGYRSIHYHLLIKPGRQEMVAEVQEMRAKVVQSEAEVPRAMAEAFRNGKLGVMDYYNMMNVISDTKMRESISGAGSSSSKPLAKTPENK